jgi:hypothetical protein
MGQAPAWPVAFLLPSQASRPTVTGDCETRAGNGEVNGRQPPSVDGHKSSDTTTRHRRPAAVSAVAWTDLAPPIY